MPVVLASKSAWRPSLAAVAALALAVLLLYRDTALGMVGIWARSDTFAHAFLVPPISAWLVWRRRAELQHLVPQARPVFLLPLALAALAWLVAEIAVVNVGAQFALVAALVLLVPLLLGTAVAGAVLFPLLFLFFAVPFGEFLLPTLMEATADFTTAALRWTGIPVYREGLQFVIPTGRWSVVEACSGVRYLIASFMVGTLFAYLNYRSPRRRALFIAVSVVVPVVANWLRAYMIVMLGHLSDNRLAVGVDHLIYGWLFFGVVISLMFLVGARWSEPEAAAAPAGRRTAAPAPFSRPAWLAATLGAAAVLTAAALAEAVLDGDDRAQGPVALALPERLAEGWQAGVGDVPLRPRFVRPLAEATREYVAGDGAAVGVYLAYYGKPTTDSKLISSDNVIVASTDRAWNQVAVAGRQVTLGVAGRIDLQSSEILGAMSPGATGQGRWTAWRLYWVDGRWSGSESAAKLALAASRLRGGRGDGAALVLFARGDAAAAPEALLERFTLNNLDRIGALLEGSRQGATGRPQDLKTSARKEKQA